MLSGISALRPVCLELHPKLQIWQSGAILYLAGGGQLSFISA